MTNNKSHRSRNLKWLTVIALLAFVVFLTYDIIITHALSYSICRADPNPETFIKRTIEYPDSIYWEDNIYPGFDEKDRLLMIRNYLDGVHVKTMALNGPNGMIYWYTAKEGDWKTSRSIKAGKRKGNYYDALDEEARAIAARGKIYTRNTMPPVNYSVVFDPIPLSEFERRYLWSDEIRIIDNATEEVIGFNRRLMRRWYRVLPDIALGNRYYAPEPMCGKSGIERFDENIFTHISRKHIPSKHHEFMEHMLYYKEELK